MTDPQRQARQTQRRRGRPRPSTLTLVLAGCAAIFFTLPLLALLVRAPWGSALDIVRDPPIREAMRLSLVCSLAATALSFVFGVPLAWVQARMSFPGQSLLRGD